MGNCVSILHYNVPVDEGVTIDEIVRVKGRSRDAVCRHPRVIAAPAELNRCLFAFMYASSPGASAQSHVPFHADSEFAW